MNTQQNNIDLSRWVILSEPGEKILSINLDNLKHIDWCTSGLSVQLTFLDDRKSFLSCKSKNAQKLAELFGINSLIGMIEVTFGCTFEELEDQQKQIPF